MKPKLTFNSPLKDVFDDEQFDSFVMKEIKSIEEQISNLKRVKGGVKDFLQKFTILEMKYQFLRLKQRKSYLTTIQKQLVNQIITNAIIKTINFYLLESVTVKELENTQTV